MRVFVTGGLGFIGVNLCRRLVLDCGWDVINLDALTYAANPSSLQELAGRANYRFVPGDICNRGLLDYLLKEFQPDAIMHLAAESHVDRSITGSAAFIQTNVVGTHALLEAALAYWERLSDASRRGAFRFLHISTDEVFGSLGETDFFRETTPYDPRSPYSASKAASDHLVSAWGHSFGLPVLISNCSNNYGPYQFPEKLVPVMILKALEGEPLPVYGDGENVRDWLYVEDHVAALERILTAGRVGETYNIGGRCEKTNIEVVRTILGLIEELAPGRGGRRSEIRFVADRPGHDRRYAVDCTKIETELGWRPAETFESGMRRTVQWYVDHREWWTEIRTTKFGGERLGLRAAT